MSESPKTKPTRTLAEFVKDKKRAGCRVCTLPENLRAELVAARGKKIALADQIEWLKAEHGMTFVRTDFETHHSAKHEQ